MLSPHYFCAHTISECLNLQLHFSALWAEPWLTLCLLFSTRWFLGLRNAVYWLSSFWPPILPGLWSDLLQRSCWWRGSISKASRNKCSKQYFSGLTISRETRASEGWMSSLVFKHLHLETLVKAKPEDVCVPLHSAAHPRFIQSQVKSLHWQDTKNLRWPIWKSSLNSSLGKVVCLSPRDLKCYN